MVRPYTAAAAAALSLIVADVALAQTYHDAGGSVLPGVVPVGGDGSGPLFTAENPGRVAGALSASLGGFQPTPSYSYQSVTTASGTFALPTGSVIVVYNTGANPITIKLGPTSVAVAAGQADVVQSNSWMAFTVGSATNYAVVGNGGPSTVVVSGGSGLPTGASGGGGGSGGTVAQGSPSSAANAWPVFESVAGSAVSSSNPLPVTFGTGVALPAFASPPTVNIGSAPTIAVTGTFWPTTQPVSWSGQSVGVSSLPALPAGSNMIGTVNVATTQPSTIASGQQTTTTSAAALPSQALVNGIVITAASANTGTVYVGPSGVTSSTGYPLAAGQSISYAVANLSAISIVGTNATDVVAFTGN